LDSERAARGTDEIASARVRDELARAQARTTAVEVVLERESQRAAKAESEARATTVQYEAALAKLVQLETSTTWRATAPLRKMLARWPGAARWLRRAAKLIWWTITLQLVRKLRARRSVPVASLPHYPLPVVRPWAAAPERENIILVVHETSRTGAPILGWNIASRLAAVYNIFTVRLGEGPLTPEFEAISVEVHGPFSKNETRDIDAEYGLRPLFDGRSFKYAIINSIEARPVLQACAKAGIPTVLLVHEFSSMVWPYKSLINAYRVASEIVFPAPIVARSALDADPGLAARPYHIIPQGMSMLPGRHKPASGSDDAKIQTLAALRAGGTMIVLGAGSVQIRKGVDLFLEVAAGVQRHAPARPVHFVWVGGGYRPREDLGYSLYLEEHLNRAGLADHFTFVDAVADMEPVYALADAFLLTSRLDPLPNVTIDAAMRGIPIICFKDASGMADLLLADPETQEGVVPHLDSAAAAEVIVRLAGDEASRYRLAAATEQCAMRTFDMDRYVDELDRLGQAAVRAERDHCGHATIGLPRFVV
jgi:glycosyltransferase involved in cell wall biosynthesis